MRITLWILLYLLAFRLAGAAGYVPPEASTGARPLQEATGIHGMVAVANPYAARAAMEMLKKGGSAADAAVAAQMVLNLVEPQSSGIGGGAFLLYYSKGKVTAFDGREAAPSADTPSLFLDKNGKPLEFYDAVVGGKSVGVPGTLRMLEMVHSKYGRLTWRTLFGPAIELCERGFIVSPRLHALLSRDRYLRLDKHARAYFYREDGSPKNVGEKLKNQELAKVFRKIANEGADAFYKGRIASDIVEAVRSNERNPGLMTLADLSGYRALEREAVCGSYRSWKLCGMPPPSSGGVAVIQIMGMLSRFDLGKNPESEMSVHLVSEAERLAFADRDRYLADPDFVRIPLAGMVDPSYLESRSSLIERSEAMKSVSPGNPPGSESIRTEGAMAMEFHSTSHLSIVDRWGNAASMTTSIEDGFGSRLMVDGFLLNNELTDFSFLPEKNGKPVANRVGPRKRPRSSMAPTFVFDDRGLYAILGSPGGPFIIDTVAKTLIALLDWHMDMAKASALPNFGSIGGPILIEKGTPLEAMQAPLEKMGHEVRIMDLNSGVHGILRISSGWEGGADPRREGIAIGY